MNMGGLNSDVRRSNFLACEGKKENKEGLIVRLTSQSATKLPRKDQLLDNWLACRPSRFFSRSAP